MENKIKIDVKTESDVATVKFYDADIEIKRTLSFTEMLLMIHEIVEGSFDSEGTYQPELTDFYYKKELIDSYTNIEIPSNPTDIYALIYNTDIYDIILEEINLYQLEEIKKSFERKIVHQVRSMEREHIATIEKFSNTLSSINGGIESLFANLENADVGDYIKEAVSSSSNGIEAKPIQDDDATNNAQTEANENIKDEEITG